MKRRVFLLILILLSVCFISIVFGAKEVKPGIIQRKAGPGSSTMQKQAKTGLPDQPRCGTQALPDIIIENIRLTGPSGALKPSQPYDVIVGLKNVGQCQTGIFLVTLKVRVQAPQDSVDQTITLETKQVASIQPCKTGSSTGTAEVLFNYATGSYRWAQYNFTATVDSSSHIEEWDELNNEKTSSDQIVDTMRQ
ncbi:MAG: hypothetical protein JW806_09130 [Sedimentisphaerales bacterium]|nr:hypothetical protein [Sedimentisphaerales bacterium]